MNVEIHRIGIRNRPEVLLERLSRLQLDELVLLSCGSGAMVATPPGVAGLWWPFHGTAVMQTSDSRRVFDRRSILVSDSQRSQDFFFPASSGGIALIASQVTWTSIASFPGAPGTLDLELFPALHLAKLSVCRQLLCFVRVLLQSAQSAMELPRSTSLATAISNLQGSFPDLISKCPGLSLSRKKTVFMRLQRVRNYLSCCTEPNLDVRKLATMANYSVCRFIRVYFAVFGETPYAQISRCRLDRAKKLLEASRERVGDVALAVGFENRSTLTRAMKKRYGLSSTQLRLSSEAAKNFTPLVPMELAAPC